MVALSNFLPPILTVVTDLQNVIPNRSTQKQLFTLFISVARNEMPNVKEVIQNDKFYVVR